MNDYEYRQGDPGDTPNGEWVRMMMRKKGIKVDRFELIRKLPAASIEIMFYNILRGGEIDV
jgi:hypothetical protein